METYINENVELRKRLEDLEINNSMLLSQLQKVQASLSPDAASTSNNTASVDDTTSSTQANSCFTLLMVMILFFAVLLGISSPSQTFAASKADHVSSMATVTAAAAAATAASNAVGSVSSSSANACLAGECSICG